MCTRIDKVDKNAIGPFMLEKTYSIHYTSSLQIKLLIYSI